MIIVQTLYLGKIYDIQKNINYFTINYYDDWLSCL